VLFTFYDLGFHLIADNGIFDKEGKTVYFTDSFSVTSHILYGQHYTIVFLIFHKYPYAFP